MFFSSNIDSVLTASWVLLLPSVTMNFIFLAESHPQEKKATSSAWLLLGTCFLQSGCSMPRGALKGENSSEGGSWQGGDSRQGLISEHKGRSAREMKDSGKRCDFCLSESLGTVRHCIIIGIEHKGFLKALVRLSQSLLFYICVDVFLTLLDNSCCPFSCHLVLFLLYPSLPPSLIVGN